MAWQKYGTNPDLDKLVDSNEWKRRIAAAKQGYGLDKLVNDKDSNVREAVAYQGYCLDILVNDKDEHVRLACFESDAWPEFCANNWETLMHHKYRYVRGAVARQGYGLDILINDREAYVRAAVARQGYSLDVLVNDDHADVRKDVARQGYGLDKLINDNDRWVRVVVAGQGYGLDVLINDYDYQVREAVAEQGYGLDKLINDEYSGVRAEVARQGYCLDKLVNDKDSYVRHAVATQGYGLDILVNDEDWYVRGAVAGQGYGLDKLVNDEDESVREAVEYYLEIHHDKLIEDWMRQNPDKIYNKDINLQLTNDLKDFIYKIDASSKLDIQTNCDNIDDFFIIKNSDELVICAIDTKEPIITIEKSISDKKLNFKFIIDITNEDGDNFIIKTTIKSKEQLSQKIEETIDSLRAHKEFSKYADDLENCL